MGSARKMSCETYKAGTDFAMDVCITTRSIAARRSLQGGQFVSDFMHEAVNVAGLDREKFWMIAIDTKLQPLALVELFSGGVSSTMVDIALTMRRLVAIPFAAGAFFVHNHPSGIATPSPDDVSLGNRLDAACKVVSMKAIDHLIITRDPGIWYGLTQGASR